MFIRSLLISISLLISLSCLAQRPSLSNLCLKSVPYNDTIALHEKHILLPATLQVFNQAGEIIDSNFYRLQVNRLIFNNAPLSSTDTLLIRYRVLQTSIDQSLFRLDSNSLQQMQEGIITAVPLNPSNNASLVDFKQLDYSGSFSRGLSFGNRQDLVLNSNFNLQLAGDLGDGLFIKAAITDENIPLQPEGNTQQLQEFDRVYVELSKNKNRLKAGDYELQNPESYFSRFFKKLQGLTFSNEINAGNGLIQNEASVAIARGKFARFNLLAIEGNQGPYKLRGAQGERFIIVLSGTERVWMDGQALARGLERDYIIDYNLGEITFTNKRLIRRETRIIVEYEYVDQTYTRTLLSTGSQWKTKNNTLSVHLYSQQDSKNTTGLFALEEDDRAVLAAAGDDLSRAVLSSRRALESFSAVQVAYESKDTITACGEASILVFSKNEEAELFTATFSFVGQGNGEYILSDSLIANEPVYTFVGRDPLTCLPIGDYEPSFQLTPPQSQQLITLRNDWTIDKQTAWLTELSFSHLDRNRFSNLDSEDDQGMAFYTNFHKTFGNGRPTKSWQLATDLAYEFKSLHFQALNPYRAPEFLRDWNLADFSGIGNVNSATEHLINNNWTLAHPDFGTAAYEFNSFLRDLDYRGFKHGLQLNLESKGWSLFSNSSLLNATTDIEDRSFLRPNIALGKTFNKGQGWTWTLALDAEDNQRRSFSSDSLSQNSYAYYNYSLAVKSPVGKRNDLSIQYNHRTDQTPQSQGLENSLIAQELSVESNWSLKKSIRLKLGFNYRNLELLNPEAPLSGQTGDNFLGRLNGSFNFWKGFVRSSVDYDIGGGQEPRRNFSFVRVRKGEGIYIWLDSLYNNDGIIQPNEMEISPFPDQAEYVRVSTFSDEFIQTNNVNFNWSFQLSPKALWFKVKQPWKQWLSKLSTQSSLRISRRTQDGGDINSWNPFELNVADTSLIAVNSGLRNIVFFNRGNPVYEVQLGWTDNRRKFLQNTGFESRINANTFLKLRLKMGAAWIAEWTIDQTRQESDSEVFNNKDYQIIAYGLKPNFSWIPSRFFQLKLRYRLEDKNNELEGSEESVTFQELGGEMTWNQNQKTSLKSRFSYIKADFRGQANSPVGFALLNGLQTGNNVIWNLSMEKQLGRNLRMILSYEGRKTVEARTVHLGRAQVAAIF